MVMRIAVLLLGAHQSIGGVADRGLGVWLEMGERGLKYVPARVWGAFLQKAGRGERGSMRVEEEEEEEEEDDEMEGAERARRMKGVRAKMMERR